MQPKFSIIIPVYNDESYIRECLDSITSQSFFDYEIIVVDDFSKDNSGKICDEYALNFKNIKVFHNEENKGSLYSRDFALKQAVGDYIMFIDGDDYFEDGFFDIINSKLSNDIDMLIFGIQKVHNNKIIYTLKVNQEEKYTPENRRDFIIKMLLDAEYNSLSTKVVKREVIQKIERTPESDYSIRRGTDLYVSLGIYRHVKNVIIIPDVLYCYRTNPTGITSIQKKNFTVNYRNREKYRELVESEECLSKEDIKMFDAHSVVKFRSQIDRVGKLKNSIDYRIQTYRQIKKEKYYLNYIKPLIVGNKDYELFLFENNMYLILIAVVKLKETVLNVLGVKTKLG